ncbi:MAG: HEAT repeat domain-containing protein [Isosphaeraceae bacterium]
MPTPNRAAPWALIVMASMTVWASGCRSPVGTTAASAMHKIQSSDDPNLRYLAFVRLGEVNVYDDDAQKADATRVLKTALASGKEPSASRAALCRSLGALGRPEARTVLRKSVEDSEPLVRAEALRALGKVGIEDDPAMLAQHMVADTSLECRIAAIEGLGMMKSLAPRYLATLTQGMENQEPAIRLASYDSLRKLTGKDLGVAPAPWKKHAEEALAKVEGNANGEAKTTKR